MCLSAEGMQLPHTFPKAWTFKLHTGIICEDLRHYFNFNKLEKTLTDKNLTLLFCTSPTWPVHSVFPCIVHATDYVQVCKSHCIEVYSMCNVMWSYTYWQPPRSVWIHPSPVRPARWPRMSEMPHGRRTLLRPLLEAWGSNESVGIGAIRWHELARQI